ETAIEFLDAAAMMRAIGTPRFYGGTRDSKGGHLHPLKLVLGLAAAAEAAGARLFERSPAARLDRRDGRQRVVTATGSVSAETVILAGNAYLSGFDADAEARFMPIN